MRGCRDRLSPYVVAMLLATSMLLARIDAAIAAAPDFPDPTYHNLRYDDDFSYLADPARRSDVWDPLKYIALGAGPYGPSYLTLGGELRERFESYVNPNFGLHAPPSSFYLLHRLQLDADLHITSHVRAFVQLGELERLGERGVTSTTDIDHLDLMQAFVDLTTPGPLGDAPLVRVGREELVFGYQRLVAVREGPNVRRDFDGFRFNDHIGGTTVDFIAVRPVSSNAAVFDDHTAMKQELWGGYLTVPIGAALKADLYWLDYQNSAARFRGITGVERRETFGVRMFGRHGGFDWNDEAALQVGSFHGHKIRAGMLAMITGYTFRAVPWQPRIAVEANYASGDNAHSSTIGTFNAMYPRLPYFAETSMLVPANIYDVQPTLTLRPNPSVLATFGWDTLWRASASDGLYGSALVEYANTNKVTGARVGSEMFADIRWRIDRHVVLGAIAAEFLSGPAVKEALGKNVTYCVLFATYRL